MDIPAEDVAAIQSALGCRVEGFPQTYLGLPLSYEKLTLTNFTMLIAKVDKYLSGWCALLLSSAGRVVLLNAVLDAIPTFAMGALELPPALLRAIEALRRAFLWNVADRAFGAKCLVAWDEGCLVGCKTGCMLVGGRHVILGFLRLSFSGTGSDLAVGVEVLGSFSRDAVLFRAIIQCCLLFLFLWIG
jgi:hypothetical protein